MTDTQRWLERVDVRPEATPPALAGLVRGISAVPADELTRNDPAATVVAARQATIDVRWRGPAFTVDGAVVWGFTGEILAAILRLGGWERPWDSGTVVELDTL